MKIHSSYILVVKQRSTSHSFDKPISTLAIG